MTMLTAKELADLRADVLELLPDTCTIQRATTATDLYGHTTQSWSNAATGVACRVDPFSVKDAGSEGVLAMREASISWYRVSVPHNTDLRYGDRIVFDGDTYELIQLYADHTLRAVRRGVIALIEGA